jgi:hypothetical protein
MGPAASTTEFEDVIDGQPPGGRCRRVRRHPSLSVKTTSMAGPLGALSVGLAASITEVEDDVDGRALGGAASRSDSVHHRV